MSLPYIYTPDVPQGSQQINNTQQPINYNFQDISTLMAVNHVPFNTADDFGKHNFVTYFQQNESPETNSTEIAVFSQDLGDGSGLQLYYRYPSNGNVYNITQSSDQSDSSSTTSTNAGSDYISYAYVPYSYGSFYLNNNIQCIMAYYAITGFPDGITGTLNFLYPVVFQYSPFSLNIGMGFIGSNTEDNITYSAALTQVTIIDNANFSVYIDTQEAVYFWAMAIGI